MKWGNCHDKLWLLGQVGFPSYQLFDYSKSSSLLMIGSRHYWSTNLIATQIPLQSHGNIHSRSFPPNAVGNTNTLLQRRFHEAIPNYLMYTKQMGCRQSPHLHSSQATLIQAFTRS